MASEHSDICAEDRNIETGWIRPEALNVELDARPTWETQQ